MSRWKTRRRAERSGEILVIGPGPRFLSGLAYHTAMVARSLDRKGYAVSLLLVRRLCPQRLYPAQERIGQTTESALGFPDVPVRSGLDWHWGPSLLRDLRWVRARRPSVVILQWWSVATAHTWVVLVYWARLLGTTVVLEMHEVNDPSEAKLPLVPTISRLAIRLMARQVDELIVHSEGDSVEIDQHFPALRGIRRSVIYLGPNEHGASEVTQHSARRRSPDEPVRFLFFGLLRSYKGIEELSVAFSALARDRQRVHLRIVGEPWDDTRADMALLRELGPELFTLEERFVPDAEVLPLFADADVFVAPYRRARGSGPIALAMATGLPLVTTRVPAILEACADYEGAVFADVEDAASLQRALAASLEMVGRRYANPHSAAVTADRYDSLVRRVTSAPFEAPLAGPLE